MSNQKSNPDNANPNNWPPFKKGMFSPIKLHPTEPTFVENKGGQSFTIQIEDGIPSCKLPVINSVGIANLCEVQEHTITRFMGTQSHVVKFQNGGELRYAYSAQGDLLELFFVQLDAYLLKNGDIFFSMIPIDEA
jgi:hypothetical protein